MKILATFGLVAALALGGFSVANAAGGDSGPTCDGPPCCGQCD